MKWLTDKKFDKEKARAYWDTGFDQASFYPIEAIYRAAQLAGWRFPIAQNLNKLEEMVERTEKALVRAGAEIYQNHDRLVRPVRIKMLAAPPAGSNKSRMTSVATLEKISEPWLNQQRPAMSISSSGRESSERESASRPMLQRQCSVDSGFGSFQPSPALSLRQHFDPIVRSRSQRISTGSRNRQELLR
jgi:hypothetical protein